MVARPSPHPFLRHPAPLAFAHRGDQEAAPENTMAAFASAVGQGFGVIETDLRASEDGVVFIFHDPTLDRMVGRPGMIESLGRAEIAKLKIRGAHHVPRLAEALEAFPNTRFNLDCKSDAAATLLPQVLARADAWDRVCVGSFDDRRLARLRGACGPKLCTSTAMKEVARVRFRSWFLPLPLPPGDCLQVPRRWRTIPIVDERFLATCHRNGLPVHVWTVNEESEMRRLLDLGVDGLMTDHPRVLKRVLEERGQWHV
jgi:glycerophosphoryl diester phosphodiesterase